MFIVNKYSFIARNDVGSHVYHNFVLFFSSFEQCFSEFVVYQYEQMLSKEDSIEIDETLYLDIGRCVSVDKINAPKCDC